VHPARLKRCGFAGGFFGNGLVQELVEFPGCQIGFQLDIDRLIGGLLA
jgi:hypothetical protein